jgi:hypothetical protein
MYGHRHGHIHLLIHELTVPTASLVREMASGKNVDGVTIRRTIKDRLGQLTAVTPFPAGRGAPRG